MKIVKLSAGIASLILILLTTGINAQNYGGRNMGRMRNMPTFKSFDLNNDGTISKLEFNNVLKARIEAREKLGGMMRNAKNLPTFKSFDTNNDGSISLKEFENHQSEFRNRRFNQ